MYIYIYISTHVYIYIYVFKCIYVMYQCAKILFRAPCVNNEDYHVHDLDTVSIPKTAFDNPSFSFTHGVHKQFSMFLFTSFGERGKANNDLLNTV